MSSVYFFVSALFVTYQSTNSRHCSTLMPFCEFLLKCRYTTIASCDTAWLTPSAVLAAANCFRSSCASYISVTLMRMTRSTKKRSDLATPRSHVCGTRKP